MKFWLILYITVILVVALIPFMLDKGYSWYAYVGGGYPALIVLVGLGFWSKELIGRKRV